ncbi:F-box protein SKIP23-like [Lolium perenne]|uniref:F-box protein SKIP23 n=1 Tax=Lolium perenne TaxID=4522 RepID=UPI003A991FCA
METCSVAMIVSFGRFGLTSLHKLLALSPGSLQKFREACSVARIMSFGQFGLTTLPKLLVLSPDSLQKFREGSPRIPTETLLPELPQDVLMDIFSLLEIPDLVRAASVCSSWRSAYSILRSHPELYRRPQTPCLFYTSESAGDNVACLYSLAEKRVYNLTLPDPPIRSRYLLGSSHGWLVTADDKSELHLVNAITAQQIALPSVITLDSVVPIFDNTGTIVNYEVWEAPDDSDSDTEMVDREMLFHAPPDELRNHIYKSAFVFPDPSTGSYIVVLIHGPGCQLSFARVGDRNWTLLPPGWEYEQCIYMDDLLYASTRYGRIDAFDLTSPTITRNIISDEIDYSIGDHWGHLYFVQGPCGGLLEVCRKSSGHLDAGYEKPIRKTDKILLHKIDIAAKGLVKINGLHDHVLFLGRSQAQCLSAEEYPQLKANSVYFTDGGEYNWQSKNIPRDIGILNLENDSTEEIASPFWCSWPSPIWITPSLTVMNMSLYK